MAQSVAHPTLSFSSSHDPKAVGSSPASGPHETWSRLAIHILPHSLSKINIKKNSKTNEKVNLKGQDLKYRREIQDYRILSHFPALPRGLRKI